MPEQILMVKSSPTRKIPGVRVNCQRIAVPRGAMAEFPSTRASLLVRLRDPRDEAAWTEFVDLYVPVIYGYARKQGLQDADAVDLSQEVITAVADAVRRLDYDRQRGAFRNWLFT